MLAVNALRGTPECCRLASLQGCKELLPGFLCIGFLEPGLPDKSVLKSR